MVFKRFAFVTLKNVSSRFKTKHQKNEIVNEAFTNNINKSFVKLKQKRFIELKKTFNILSLLTFAKKIEDKKKLCHGRLQFCKKSKKVSLVTNQRCEIKASIFMSHKIRLFLSLRVGKEIGRTVRLELLQKMSKVGKVLTAKIAETFFTAP